MNPVTMLLTLTLLALPHLNLGPTPVTDAGTAVVEGRDYPSADDKAFLEMKAAAFLAPALSHVYGASYSFRSAYYSDGSRGKVAVLVFSITAKTATAPASVALVSFYDHGQWRMLPDLMLLQRR